MFRPSGFVVCVTKLAIVCEPLAQNELYNRLRSPRNSRRFILDHQRPVASLLEAVAY